LLRVARWHQAELEAWSVDDVQTFIRCLRMPGLAAELLEEQVDGTGTALRRSLPHAILRTLSVCACDHFAVPTSCCV
jgi:hypothetical protein